MNHLARKIESIYTMKVRWLLLLTQLVLLYFPVIHLLFLFAGFCSLARAAFEGIASSPLECLGLIFAGICDCDFSNAKVWAIQKYSALGIWIVSNSDSS